MTNEELFAATAIKTWNTIAARLEKILSTLKDEEFQLQVAPGRNRVYYIVGHLTAHHDRLLSMLALGERLYPELDELFITNPDRTFPDEVSAAELRKMFANVNAQVTSAIGALAPAALLQKHEAVSVEDFEKDPLRSRLAVLEIRTAHAMYHAGQIRLVSTP